MRRARSGKYNSAFALTLQRGKWRTQAGDNQAAKKETGELALDVRLKYADKAQPAGVSAPEKVGRRYRTVQELAEAREELRDGVRLAQRRAREREKEA